MNILIVAKLLNPYSSIGGVRQYNMATELDRMGHTVFCVVSEKLQYESHPDYGSIRLFYVPEGKTGRRITPQPKAAPDGKQPQLPAPAPAPRKRSKLNRWLHMVGYQMLATQAEQEWYHNAAAVCRKILEEEKIDVLMTSYGPICNLLVGLEMKKVYPRIPWVSDMRDPVDSMHYQLVWRLRGAFLQKKMLHRADRVVTVCDGITHRYKAMLPENQRSKVHTITNGYREEPILCTPAEDGILRIGYTGQLYRGTSDMSQLFRCIHVLEQELGADLPLEIHYAGPHETTVMSQAEPYDAGKYVVAHGKISQTEALRLQETCDVLCVLTWNTHREQGVLTGKFLEYLRLRKPILAIVTGDLAGAELSRRIDDLNIGFSYECIRHETDFPRMKAWLKTAMERKRENQPLIGELDEEKLGGYAFPNLAKQMEQLLQF